MNIPTKEQETSGIERGWTTNAIKTKPDKVLMDFVMREIEMGRNKLILMYNKNQKNILPYKIPHLNFYKK